MLTVAQFIPKYWRPSLDRRALKPSTRQSYECALKNVVLPALGPLRLTEVTPLHIEDLIQNRLGSGVGTKTLRNDLGVIEAIFALAVDHDLITRNPVRKCHKPKLVRTEKPVWTTEQVRNIIISTPAEFQPLITCVALTGIRLGELLGLQWQHVDLNHNLLHIRQALWNNQLVPPKTQKSIRSIPFGPVLRSALEQQWEQSEHRRPEDFVFCRKDGSHLSGDVLRRDVLYPILDRLHIDRRIRQAFTPFATRLRVLSTRKPATSGLPRIFSAIPTSR